jgi:ribosomal protein L39E
MEKSFRKALCAKKERVNNPFPVGKRVVTENRIFYVSYQGDTYDGVAVYGIATKGI